MGFVKNDAIETIEEINPGGIAFTIKKGTKGYVDTVHWNGNLTVVLDSHGTKKTLRDQDSKLFKKRR